MDLITVGVAALVGIVTNLLYDVLKNHLRKSSESRRVSVRLPSGQEYETDSPVDDNEEFNRFLRSLIYSTESMSIDKKENVRLLDDVVTPSVSALKNSLEKKHISLDVGDFGNVPTVNVDSEALQQVIFNLLDNAIEYSYPGGRIEIDGKETDDSVEVTISSASGVEIKPAELENIFERGFRGEEAALKERTGAGMGLFVARNLVEAHDGKLSVQPYEDLVTTKIEIPLAASNMMDEEPESAG